MTEEELEELRKQMFAVLGDPREEGFWESLTTTVVNHKAAGRSADDLRKVFMHGLREARLYSVPSAMAKLAERQALSSPAEPLGVGDAPSPHGLLVFEEEVTAVYAANADGGDVRTIQMSGLLWTEARSAAGPTGVVAYALMQDVYMPGVAMVLAHGRSLGPVADRQAIFFKVMQACWRLM